jgi:hypothetical protein
LHFVLPRRYCSAEGYSDMKSDKRNQPSELLCGGNVSTELRRPESIEMFTFIDAPINRSRL